MGMFDWVRCQRVMPDGLDARGAAADNFQSKDLDCNLDRIEITEAGRLLRHRHDDREQSATDTNFHGHFNFYCSRRDERGGAVETAP